MARRGTERVDHIDVKALWYQEATEQGRLLDVAESDTKTLSADSIVHPTTRLQNKSDVTNWK